ncbi:cAMP-binding domain of CRP or a regulatory subunit of cAMP-dependent protein kinases [Limimonas halophila]|uniref:cAMP-binding domain of CRP or a regulatory subunit of cAMP-dependent protein kinases n=1 Tax=Limimonas halophila TaxID=1082479 RepID=A0A1G7TVI2_9PROT|nr:Crp/Fnr family transcriptional regulator [Limimonas halophila]SDG39273.1 cAMP-binding domain of CRP or a regulatory subunit of cAMP-dependent protein kinases [Limimonas halophila]
MTRTPLADRLAEVGALSPQQRDRLSGLAGRRVVLRRRTALIHEGETATWFPVVEQGWLEHERILADGRRCAVQVSLPGDLADTVMPLTGRAQFTITATTDARVHLVDAAGFMRLLHDDPAVARAFTGLQAVSECRARERLVALARMSAYEKLSFLCLELLSRLEAAGHANGGGFELALSQRTLGEVLGLHAVHVNRMFHRLEADGFIVRDGSFIRVVDRDILADLVDFRPCHGWHACRPDDRS